MIFFAVGEECDIRGCLCVVGVRLSRDCEG